MEIPKHLTKALLNKEVQKEKIKQEEIEERRLEKEKENTFRKKEKSLSSQKLKLCQDILSWAHDFRETEEGEKFLAQKDFLGEEEAEVTLDARRCDPKTGKDSYKPYLTFEVTRCSVLYGERWSWMGVKKLEFTEPKKMAKRIPFAYLQLLWKHLDSGEVFKFLVGGLE
jgi:hypothetical protein